MIHDAHYLFLSSGSKRSTFEDPPLTVLASTMWGATERSFRSELMRASSSRLPPQRTLVTFRHFPTATQFAARACRGVPRGG